MNGDKRKGVNYQHHNFPITIHQLLPYNIYYDLWHAVKQISSQDLQIAWIFEFFKNCQKKFFTEKLKTLSEKAWNFSQTLWF